jgi:NAD(P)-dependent dehydrogenase (short-subunit alcohol dehydrogenase family)
MSKDSVRASGAEGPGRLGEGQVYADIYRHGTNPRSTRKYFRGFTVRAYFQCALHCYSDAWSTIVQRFSAVLLSFEGPKPRQYPSARDWPYPESTTITMANGAVTSMVRNLAVELARVRVNAIHSGAVGDSPAVTTRHDRGKPAKADLD